MAASGDANDTTSYHLSNATTNAYIIYYYGIAEDIYFYGLCVILPFGLVGNLLTVYVFLRSSCLRKTTTGRWLVALALADSVVLVGEMFRWLSSCRQDASGGNSYYFPSSWGLNFVDTSGTACKMTNMLRYSGNLWSAWITVAIAVERLVAVAWPLKIGRVFTLRRVQVIIALIAFGGLALGLFPFWTLDREFVENGRPLCRISDVPAYKLWNDVVVKSVILAIPCVLITILTAVIIGLLYRARNQRESCVSPSVRSVAASSKTISVEARLTVMLVAVCVATVALRSPYTIAYSVRSSVWDTEPDDRTDAITYFASRFTDMINTINYAVNFLLYCLCGSSFRKECAKLFCCSGNKQDQIGKSTELASCSVKD